MIAAMASPDGGPMMTPAPAFRRLTAATLLAFSATPAVAEAPLDDLAAIVEAWIASPHADHRSLSFTYWNSEGAVPENCAACHSEPGLHRLPRRRRQRGGRREPPRRDQRRDRLRLLPHLGRPCARHRDAAFGVEVHGLGGNATCTVCHAGRASGDAVAAPRSGSARMVSPDLGFINVHYGIAAAVMQGGEGRAGFHYPDQSYAGPVPSRPGADTCIACHDAHTTRKSKPTAA
jgi:hypothetical protein